VATLSPAQIYQLARDAGLSAAAATIATAVALAESGGRTDAMGDVGLQNGTWGPSIGLWQIRSIKAQSGTGQPRDATRLTDPAFNAQSMIAISGAGKNWKPWTTYTSGAYKKNLSRVTSTVPGSTTSGSGTTTSVGGPSGVPSTRSGESSASSMGGVLGGAFTVGRTVAGAVAAAALVIVGALNTVK
jgi:hypothetical protein